MNNLILSLLDKEEKREGQKIKVENENTTQLLQKCIKTAAGNRECPPAACSKS